MAITFHCHHCGKKIEAQDSAAGRWAKCPACHNKIYVPDLKEDEELKLAPIDETEEERKKRLMAETYQLTQDILQERESPEGASAPSYRIDDDLLRKRITKYLRQMADGQLDQAEKTAQTIAPYGPQAVRILDEIAVSEIPESEVSEVPQHVLAGLIRKLRTRLS